MKKIIKKNIILMHLLAMLVLCFIGISCKKEKCATTIYPASGLWQLNYWPEGFPNQQVRLIMALEKNGNVFVNNKINGNWIITNNMLNLISDEDTIDIPWNTSSKLENGTKNKNSEKTICNFIKL